MDSEGEGSESERVRRGLKDDSLRDLSDITIGHLRVLFAGTKELSIAAAYHR